MVDKIAIETLAARVRRLRLQDRMTEAVQRERDSQERVWGHQRHPMGTGREGDVELAEFYRTICDSKEADGTVQWRDILLEEVTEVLVETDPHKLLTELVQLAAVAVAMGEQVLEELDKNG